MEKKYWHLLKKTFKRVDKRDEITPFAAIAAKCFQRKLHAAETYNENILLI
jgi:hypothetical protein